MRLFGDNPDMKTMLKKIALIILLSSILFETRLTAGKSLFDALDSAYCESDFTYYRYLTDGERYAELMRFDSLDAESILSALCVRRVFEEEVAGIKILYGYSEQLSGFCMLKGRRVNIQIADNGEYVLAGSPYIPDGF